MMMNREEVVQLGNGKAMDILVAEQIMGWQLEKDDAEIKRLNGYFAHHEERRWWRMPNGGWYDEPPAYSTSIAAAWQVVESLNTQGYKLHLSQGDQESKAGFTLAVMNAEYITEKSVPEAICKAALLVVPNSVLAAQRSA